MLLLLLPEPGPRWSNSKRWACTDVTSTSKALFSYDGSFDAGKQSFAIARLDEQKSFHGPHGHLPRGCHEPQWEDSGQTTQR